MKRGRQKSAIALVYLALVGIKNLFRRMVSVVESEELITYE